MWNFQIFDLCHTTWGIRHHVSAKYSKVPLLSPDVRSDAGNRCPSPAEKKNTNWMDDLTISQKGLFVFSSVFLTCFLLHLVVLRILDDMLFHTVFLSLCFLFNGFFFDPPSISLSLAFQVSTSSTKSNKCAPLGLWRVSNVQWAPMAPMAGSLGIPAQRVERWSQKSPIHLDLTGVWVNQSF